MAAVIDLFPRRVVGWSMSAAMTAELVTDALAMAIWRRGRPRALLHHSDRGSSSRDSAGRFASHLDELASVIGHAARVGAMRDYCTGLLLPCERKSVAPIAAVTAPQRVGAQRAPPVSPRADDTAAK